VYRCERRDCQETYQRHEAFHGSFCSPRCRHIDRGQKVLNLFRNDHTYCATCFGKLKELEHPTEEAIWKRRGEETRQAMCAFQYRTERAEVGLKSHQIDEYREATRMGTICKCGATAIHERDEILERVDLQETIRNFHTAIADKRAGGETPVEIDYKTMIRNLWNRDSDELQWEYAIGVGIEAAERASGDEDVEDLCSPDPAGGDDHDVFPAGDDVPTH
jgi:hypothetical protein